MKSLEIVVDTNVLLESSSIFWKLVTKKGQIKHPILGGDGENDYNIVILQIVLEELDGLKKNYTDNVGYFQRKTIQKIFSSMEDIRIIQDIKELLEERFSKKSQDNIILNTIIELQERDKDKHYILYTNDIQLLLKQKMYNVDFYTDIEKIDVKQIQDNLIKYDIQEENYDLLNELLNTKKVDNSINLINGYGKFYYTENKLITEIPFKNYKNTIQYITNDNFGHYNKKCKKILPKNQDQSIFLDQILDEYVNIITSMSPSGTGKTLLQLYGQIQLLSTPKQLQHYNKIVFIVNPSMSQSRHKELGFLPGSKHEKILPFIQGIIDNLNYLFDNKIPDEFNLELMEKSELFEIRPINYIRGSSISKSIVIVDEIQNLTHLEIKTVISRIQDTSKLILIGDVNQIDEQMALDAIGIVKLINAMNKKKQKLNWLNISLKKSIRSEFINILDDYFNNIFEEEIE